MMAIGKLTALKPTGANTLELRWDDGRIAEVSLRDVIAGRAALKPIRAAKAFAQAKLSRDGWSVEWPEEIDFGATQLRRWADEQAGETMPAADFREWMEAHALTLDSAARALGLSRRMIAYYLSGEKPIPKTVLWAVEGLWGSRAVKPFRRMSAELMVERFHDASIDSLSAFGIQKNEMRSRTLLALYGSLIEYVGTMLMMTRRRARVGFASVHRSLLECVVDAINLANQANYANELEAKDIKEWLKVLRGADQGNQYLVGIASSPGRRQAMRTWEARLKTLEAEGYGKLTFEAAFKKAGMLDEYKSVYNFESVEAHNNLRALEKRHFAEGQDRLALYDEVDDAYFEVRLATSGHHLIRVGVAIHELFKTKEAASLQAVRDEFNLTEVVVEA